VKARLPKQIMRDKNLGEHACLASHCPALRDSTARGHDRQLAVAASILRFQLQRKAST
jgi:hypothetical protein